MKIANTKSLYENMAENLVKKLPTSLKMFDRIEVLSNETFGKTTKDIP